MKRIAVTGFTGSFGSAFLSDTFARYPETVIVGVSRDEVKQGAVREKWPDRPGQPGERLRCFLGDVRDRDRLTHAFVGCDVVVHAAALKRVDQGAYNVDELIKTNILGTMNVISAAAQCRVPKVVVLSTDKVPEAVNSYGASKAMAEFYAIQSNTYHWPAGTAIAAVRYGNVWGSRGSVLEVWRHRVDRGEPLHLTDSGCTRFWMSIQDAVELVHVAIREAGPGEVLIPELPAVDMLSVAVALGGPDVKIIETGLRPGGEKLHELLATGEQMERAIVHRAHPTLGTLYAIQPSPKHWGTEVFGKPPPVQYRRDGLRSDRVRRLAVPEIRERIAA